MDDSLLKWAMRFGDTVEDFEADFIDSENVKVSAKNAWSSGNVDNAVVATFRDRDGDKYIIALSKFIPSKTEEQVADEEAKLTAAGPGEIDREQHPVPNSPPAGEHGESFD